MSINSMQPVPGKFGPMGTEPMLRETVPAKFNSATTLTVDIVPGKSDYDFELTSK